MRPAEARCRDRVMIMSEFVGCSSSLSRGVPREPMERGRRGGRHVPRGDAQRRGGEKRHEALEVHQRAHCRYWARRTSPSCSARRRRPARRCYGLGFGLSFRVVTLNPDFRKLDSLGCSTGTLDPQARHLARLRRHPRAVHKPDQPRPVSSSSASDDWRWIRTTPWCASCPGDSERPWTSGLGRTPWRWPSRRARVLVQGAAGRRHGWQLAPAARRSTSRNGTRS